MEKKNLMVYCAIGLSILSVSYLIALSLRKSMAVGNADLKTRVELTQLANENIALMAELQSKVAFKVAIHRIEVDGTRVASLNTNNSYTLTSQSCNGDETVTWDDEAKLIAIEGLSSSTVCDVSFTTN